MSHGRIPLLAPRGTATADFVENAVRVAANSTRIDVKAFAATLPCLVVAGFLICAPSRTMLAAPAGYVAEAVSDAHRGRDAEADARRHPAELAEFAGLKPGDIVVDLVPGSGYFTRIFSRIVGPRGHVYAVWPIEYARIDGDEVQAVQQLAADPHYSNVTVLVQPAAKFSIPAKADVVWTSQELSRLPVPVHGAGRSRTAGAIDPASSEAAWRFRWRRSCRAGGLRPARHRIDATRRSETGQDKRDGGWIQIRRR